MKTKIFSLFLIAGIASFFIFLQIKDGSTQAVRLANNPADSGCLKCHEGIEQISDGPVMSKLTCVQCHMGNPNGSTKEDAHKGMYANPSDFRVFEKCYNAIISRWLMLLQQYPT